MRGEGEKKSSATHHIMSDLVLAVQVLQVLCRPCLVRVSSEVGSH